MNILYTSDIHANPRHLFSLLSTAGHKDVDAIIIGGDLIPHNISSPQRVSILQSQALYLKNLFLGAIREFKDKKDIPIYLDLSNDDFICNRSILKDQVGDLFHLLHMEKHPLTDSIDIIGYMNVPPTPFGRKDWEKPDSRMRPYTPGNNINLKGCVSSKGILEDITINPASDDTIENDLDRLSMIVDRPFIFVSHTPPYGTPLDVIYNGLHVGSVSVKNFIEKWSMEKKIIVSLHGHIHESPDRSGSISTTINNVKCINPGQGSGTNGVFRYVILRLREDRTPATIEIENTGPFK